MDYIVLAITLSCAFLVLHVYLGYPLTLYLLTKMGVGTRNLVQEKFEPTVTMMVSCYNEIDVIQEKITNCLELQYPLNKLNFIIISDGSDDGTDEAVLQFNHPRIKLIRQEGRLGKTSAINLAMQSVESEIVVFSDANAMYEPDAIQKLVRNFYDPKVGYVVGAALYIDGKDSSAAASENLYWNYEIALKKQESLLHSVVGGDGAIYAIKRELFIPLDAKDINDFVNPLQIIEQGFRGIFEEQAVCLEETAGDFAKEAKRKQRIVNRSFRGLMKVKSVLNPFRFGFFSYEVISHKLLRWLMPIFLVIFSLGSLVLSYSDYLLFQVISILALIFFILAQVGFLLSEQKKSSPIFFIPYYFVMVNYYSLIGVITALQGNIQVTWSSPRHKLEKKNTFNWSKILIAIVVNSVIVILLCDIFNKIIN
ncbi:glycosyltransferase family 2 protein [Catenovulum sp. 2E275]|uniref:glycosyltransferase family 2 protein n=1 Tax=Catenovulum sp. 2E275 TaxID=2980497 RepID=UPI0021CF4950|nr:glycosyltransferase family 2 protein [Catenovulum sp. 2E275]MCU4675545.1 glycosyltransferase family 2 protein [Catenovulum sp. 2E275]